MSSAPKTLDVFVLQEEDKMRMESANFVKTPFVIHVIQQLIANNVYKMLNLILIMIVSATAVIFLMIMEFIWNADHVIQGV